MKLFDIFIQGTIDIIYFISSFYDEVYICKPVTSRPANSEKYIVCKNFKYQNTSKYYPVFLETAKICEKEPEMFIEQFLNINMHDIFINRLEEINIMLGQKQIQNINTTLMLIENKLLNEIIEHYKYKNIQTCVKWLKEHDIPVYTPHHCGYKKHN